MKPQSPTIKDFQDRPELRAFLFDFDGVIADTEPLHAESYVRVLPKFGIPIRTEDFPPYIGQPELKIYEQLERQWGVVLDKEKVIKERLTDYLAAVEAAGLRPYQYVEPLLSFLVSDNRRCYVVSSQRREILETLLRQWALSHYFTGVRSAYDGKTLSSKEDLIKAVIRELAVAPQSTVLFEDSVSAIAIAKRLGIHTVYVSHSMNPRHVSSDWILNTTAVIRGTNKA